MPAPAPPDFVDDLSRSLEQAWSLLERGAADRRSPAHTPSLASAGLDGRPALRTVVLRACSRSQRQLLIHTDRRSRKLQELHAEPRCALHVYDAAHKIQLRLACLATIHLRDALADLQWSRSQPSSRQIYGLGLAPGSRVEHPHAATPDLSQRGAAEQRENFAVLGLEIQAIEWLYLAAHGHRRALFRLEEPARSEWWAP